MQIILFPLTVADPTRDNALFMPPKTTEMNANADEKEERKELPSSFVFSNVASTCALPTFTGLIRVTF